MTQDFTQVKTLLDASPIAMVISDPMDKVILCNKAACQLLGHKSSELIGKALTPLANELPFDIQASPYQWEDETYTLSTLQPKQTAYPLEEIQERYFALLEGTDAAIAMFSFDGTLRFANSLAAKRLGIDLPELVGKNIMDLFPTPIAVRQIVDIQRVISTGEGHSYESPSTIQGTTFWHRTSIEPVRNASGEITFALLNSIDISQQKTAEFALKESEGRLQLALNGIDLGWWDSNIKTGEIIYNEHWMNLMGFEPGQNMLTVAEMGERIHHEDLPKILGVIFQHFKKRPNHSSYEYRFKNGNGEWKWILDLGKVVEWDSEGRAVRAAGICLDITDRVDINKTLIEQKRLLEQKNEELEEFSYLSAHDLKSPIVSMVALLEHLHLEDIENTEKEELTKVLLQSAHQIQHKIISLNEIIALKKTFPLPSEKIDIENSLKQVIALLGGQISSTKADIQVDFSKSNALYFPPAHFQQILQHVISNSIKFRRENESPKIHLFSIKNSKYVTLVIQDSGTGFDMKKNGDKVFGIFNRFHSKTEGIGAGLYIVYSIMSHYHGKIEIESERGKGTTVTLHFRENHTD